MLLHRFTRIDDGVPTKMTRDKIRPFLKLAMEKYLELLTPEFGNDLISVEEAMSKVLSDHKLILLNEDYLIAYSLKSEWYAKGFVLCEEFLIRVGEGSTTLLEVFETLRAFALLEGAKWSQIGTRAPENKEAIRKLYKRYGATEIMTVMRC